ncbi:DUF4232 domain-containing protein [Acidihalobacter ferrooxydans]|uniref:DUF4232 domain-containing protein n=1 Tax=Acidihalobacter ferrooxydans TaxID=1765967 RepID=A0A1P8UK57_9GAMM|nr:DUF4232 domain-containing protein [Acidihalobacter ferrooxydans]APZ44207.1 hypothetical protein BW247_14845 [Acidihalobacter ferrooxydans]
MRLTRLIVPALATAGILTGCATSPTTRQTPRCKATQLALHAGQAEAGMGHVTLPLVIENRSNARCVLSGTPRLQLLAVGHRKLPTHQRADPYAAPAGTFTLAPGAAARFTLHYATATGYSGASCPSAAALNVTLAHLRRPLHLRLRIDAYGGLLPHPACGTLWVSPLQPGAPQPNN